jgi:hypothetical protein
LIREEGKRRMRRPAMRKLERAGDADEKTAGTGALITDPSTVILQHGGFWFTGTVAFIL